VVTDWAEALRAKLMPSNVLRAAARPDRTNWDALIWGEDRRNPRKQISRELTFGVGRVKKILGSVRYRSATVPSSASYDVWNVMCDRVMNL
jgi:hypothetical protein